MSVDTTDTAPPATMQAAFAVSGELVALEWRAVPTPTPAVGEVLIRIAYTGLNRADILQLEGKYPPPEGASPIPGLEVSGHIVGLGEGVTDFSLGQPVCALLTSGGYAEYVVVPAAQTLAIPENTSLAQAACLPEALATAVMALVGEAQLSPGERVFMHGGTSGVGLMLLQLARAMGAEVLTSVGSDAKVAFLAPFGIPAFNHSTTLFPDAIRTHWPEGADVIIDTLGGPQLETHLGLLRRGGRLVTLGLLEGQTVQTAKIGRMLTHRLRWSGTTLRAQSADQKAELMAYLARKIWPMVVDGRIRPVIDRGFPCADAEKALARMQERLHLGKILLER